VNYANFVRIQEILSSSGTEFTAHWESSTSGGTIQFEYSPEVSPPYFPELVGLAELGKIAIKPSTDDQHWLMVTIT